MSWGIAETASEIEKIKSESADYLNGLNSCGVIDWNTYNYAFDFYENLLMEAYEQGEKDAQPDPCDDPRADVYYLAEKIGIHRLYALVVALRGEPEPCEDAVSREALRKVMYHRAFETDGDTMWQSGCWVRYRAVEQVIKELPSVQPERTCVNCGRTANNGGWYADGRTRCPIEEHYALPKDGYCHLWEKRNVIDDDYPERRTDGRD